MRLWKTADEERKVFDDLYIKYHKAVYQNIRKLVQDEDASLDILQEVFLSLWENKDKVLFEESVGGWLFVVSYNKSMSLLRKQVKTSVIDEENPELISDSYSTLQREREFDLKMNVLNEAVNLLPPRKQEAFKLHRFEGMSKEEVALEMELSKETVMDYLKQSNQMIKKYISHHYPSLLALGASLSILEYFS